MIELGIVTVSGLNVKAAWEIFGWCQWGLCIIWFQLVYSLSHNNSIMGCRIQTNSFKEVCVLKDLCSYQMMEFFLILFSKLTCGSIILLHVKFVFAFRSRECVWTIQKCWLVELWHVIIWTTHGWGNMNAFWYKVMLTVGAISSMRCDQASHFVILRV